MREEIKSEILKIKKRVSKERKIRVRKERKKRVRKERKIE